MARGVCPAAPATATRPPNRPPSARPTRKPGLPADQLTVRTTVVTATAAGGHWTYTTVIADAPELLETVPNRESSELRWVAEDEVTALPLHPGFAASWERLRTVTASIPLLVTLRERRFQSLRRGPRIVGRRDRPHHHDPACARGEHFRQPLGVDAADREPGLVGVQIGRGANQVQSGGRASRLGGRGPARADAEVVHLFGHRGGDLSLVVGGPADKRARTQDVAGEQQRQVVLAQVQHIGAGRPGDIGAVVDRQQRAVPSCRVAQQIEGGQLVAGLQRPEPLLAGRALVPQLDDVHPTGQRRVGEFGQVPAFTAGVGTQVQGRTREALTGLVHTANASAFPRVGLLGDTGVPGAGTESGRTNLPLPSHLIRVMPAKGARRMPQAHLPARRRDHWPSWAAASSDCRSRAGPRSTAGRSACTEATSTARPGWPAACWPRTAKAGPARNGCCGWAWRRCGCGTVDFSTGMPADVVTARESLVVAVDRADAADLKTVGEWLAAQGHPVTRDVERTRHRTGTGARHSAWLPGRNRTRR